MYMNMRRNKEFNLDLCNIKIFFWYKHIPSEDFQLLRLYNNAMLMWLIFKQKSIVINHRSSFRLNVYYERASLISNVSGKNILYFFDVYVNGFLPSIRKVSIKFIFVNQKLIIDISDLSFFTSLKLGRFFYVENVTDNVLFEFSSLKKNIKPYLTLFKINGL